MNIIDAIKSGKRFKRQGSKEFLLSKDSARSPEGVMAYLNYADLLADDWEVETVKKLLSAEDVRHALMTMDFSDLGHPPRDSAYFVPRLLKLLGLE